MNSAFGVDHGDEVSKSAKSYTAVSAASGVAAGGAALAWNKHKRGSALKPRYDSKFKRNPDKVTKSADPFEVEKFFGAPMAGAAKTAAGAAKRVTAAGFKPGAHGNAAVQGKGFTLKTAATPGQRAGKAGSHKAPGMSTKKKAGIAGAGAAAGLGGYSMSKALAAPMPKMAKLTKPGAMGGAKKAGGPAAGANPMLRQVNRLTQGAAAPMAGRAGAPLANRLGAQRNNVRAGAAKNSQMGGLRSRLGGGR